MPLYPSQTPTYKAWYMLLRNHRAETCPEWGRFETFLKDMGEKPDGTALRWDRSLGVAGRGSCSWSSCGIWQHQGKLRHGATSGRKPTREYRAWQEMKKRCLRRTSKRFADYGGRGITIHPEWLNFEGFFRDMGPCPEGRSLDRIDNEKGYEPGNCRWATTKEQNRNQRTNIWTTFCGERVKVVDLAERFGLNLKLLRTRILRKGLSGEEAVREMQADPPKRRLRRSATLGGRSVSLVEAAKVLGVGYSQVYTAAIVDGLSLDEWAASQNLTPPA